MQKRKLLLPVLLCAVLLCSLFTGCSNKKSEYPMDAQPDVENAHHVEIKIEGYGTMKAELYEDIAPITVKNFMKLAESGFYDGLTIHRVLANFMIQGGCPNGDGTGDSGESIKGEFYANGVPNGLSHTRGVISMARTEDYDSASSQFFILQKDTPRLDGEYAAFGKVTEGMEVVDDICKNVFKSDSSGSVFRDSQPVIEYIKVID